MLGYIVRVDKDKLDKGKLNRGKRDMLLLFITLGKPSKKKKSGKFWNLSKFKLTPPPWDNWDIFDFQNILKITDPPPIGPISEHFDFFLKILRV